MGSQPSAEFKGAESTPIEALKLTLESKPHRDELKKILDEKEELKQQVLEIIGCGEPILESIFEEDDNAYVQLVSELGQDKKKEEELAQLLFSIQTKQ